MSFPNSPEPPTEAEASATGNIENSDENLSEKPESTGEDPKAEQDQNSKNRDGPETREEPQTTPDDASRDSEAPEPSGNPQARREVPKPNSQKYKNLKAHFLSTSPRWSPSFSISPAPPAPEVPEDSKSPPATPTPILIGPSGAPLASMFPTHRGISMWNGKPARDEQSQEASRGEPNSGESAQRNAQTTMQNLARTLGQMSLKPREFAIPVRRRGRNLASTGFSVQGSSAFTGAESENLAPGPSEPAGSDPPLVRAKTPDYSNIRFYPFAPGMFLYANPPPIKPQTRFENHQYLVPAKPLFSEPATLSAVAPATYNAPLNRNQSGQGADLPANTPVSSPAHPLNPPDVLEDEPQIPAYNQDFGEDDGFQIPGHGLPPVPMPDPTVDWQGSYYELQAENIRLNLYLYHQVRVGNEKEEFLDKSMDLNRIREEKIGKLEAEIESLKNNCEGWRLYEKLQVVHSKHLEKFEKLESDYKAALKKLKGSRNEPKDQEEVAKKFGMIIEEEKGTEEVDIREQQMRTISELIKEVNDMKLSRDSKESEKELAKLKRQTMDTVESVKSQMENLKDELAFVEDTFNTLETCKKEIDEQIKNSQKLIDEALNVVIKDEEV